VSDDGATPRRAIRIPDELWAAALARAKNEDISLSQLIRRWLTDFIANGDYLARRPKKRG
jgi:predicted HicB family RNase H-like nuclease